MGEGKRWVFFNITGGHRKLTSWADQSDSSYVLIITEGVEYLTHLLWSILNLLWRKNGVDLQNA